MESMKNDVEIPFKCLEITKEKLKNVKYILNEEGKHFSQEILDNYIEEIIIQEENRGTA